MQSSTFFETNNAARYLGTLCKHFGHKVPAELTGRTGAVTFPFAKCEMTADATGLSMTVTATNGSDLDKAVQVMSSHLERFAFREAPNLAWIKSASELT